MRDLRLHAVMLHALIHSWDPRPDLPAWSSETLSETLILPLWLPERPSPLLDARALSPGLGEPDALWEMLKPDPHEPCASFLRHARPNLPVASHGMEIGWGAALRMSIFDPQTLLASQHLGPAARASELQEALWLWLQRRAHEGLGAPSSPWIHARLGSRSSAEAWGQLETELAQTERDTLSAMSAQAGDGERGRGRL